jgi:hypothetical protein
MRFSRIIILFFILLSLLACNKFEKENIHLKDELGMVREENDYLKAEIIGLKKELAHLTSKVEEERAALQTKFAEERQALQKKFTEEREALQKKTQETLKKKNSNGKKETAQKETSSPLKKDTKEQGLRPVPPVKSNEPKPPQGTQSPKVQSM